MLIIPRVSAVRGAAIARKKISLGRSPHRLDFGPPCGHASPETLGWGCHPPVTGGHPACRGGWIGDRGGLNALTSELGRDDSLVKPFRIDGSPRRREPVGSLLWPRSIPSSGRRPRHRTNRPVRRCAGSEGPPNETAHLFTVEIGRTARHHAFQAGRGAGRVLAIFRSLLRQPAPAILRSSCSRSARTLPAIA